MTNEGTTLKQVYKQHTPQVEVSWKEIISFTNKMNPWIYLTLSVFSTIYEISATFQDSDTLLHRNNLPGKIYEIG